MMNAVIGATLLHLEIQTRSTTDKIGTIFFFRSIGQLSGNILTILSFKYAPWRIQITLIFGCVLLVAMNLSLPWCTSFLFLTLIFIGAGCGQGMAGGGGCGPLLIKIWGLRAGPFLQALFFIHSLGAMVAPLFVDLMMKNNQYLRASEKVEITGVSNLTTNNSQLAKLAITQTSDDYNSGSSNSSILGSLDPSRFNNQINKSLGSEIIPKNHELMKYDLYSSSALSPIFYPYLMPAVGAAVAVILYFLVFILFNEKDETDFKATQIITKNIVEDKKTGVPIILVGILMLFTLLQGALECTFGGWIVVFVVRYLGESYSSATTSATCFWGAQALGRGVCVITSKFFTHKQILAVHLTLLAMSAIFMISFCRTHIAVTLVCSLFYGFSLGPILGIVMMYCQTIVELPQWLLSLVHSNMYVGFMVFPALVGYLFANYSPLYLLYTILMCIFVMIILFVMLYVYEKFILGKSNQKSANIEVINIDNSSKKPKDFAKLQALKDIQIYKSQSSLC